MMRTVPPIRASSAPERAKPSPSRRASSRERPRTNSKAPRRPRATATSRGKNKGESTTVPPPSPSRSLGIETCPGATTKYRSRAPRTKTDPSHRSTPPLPPPVLAADLFQQGLGGRHLIGPLAAEWLRRHVFHLLPDARHQCLEGVILRDLLDGVAELGDHRFRRALDGEEGDPEVGLDVEPLLLQRGYSGEGRPALPPRQTQSPDLPGAEVREDHGRGGGGRRPPPPP